MESKACVMGYNRLGLMNIQCQCLLAFFVVELLVKKTITMYSQWNS